MPYIVYVVVALGAENLIFRAMFQTEDNDAGFRETFEHIFAGALPHDFLPR